ncbi:MAG: hypothetical protein KDK70_22960 [Myxococcales bacterium]|nr:hypothetical protein [Myxococcales bacterium]
MKPCPSCDRHLRGTERTCPFCGEPLREVTASLLAVISLATVLAGCTEDPPADPTSSSGLDSTGASSISGTGMVGSSTGPFETTAVDSDDATTDGSSGGGFIYGDPDGGDVFPCDPFQQDCPEGEKCVPWANDGGSTWNDTRCAPVVPDPVPPGEPCTVEGSGTSGIDDCAAGAMCWDVDPDTNAGTCVALCMGSEAAPVCDEAGTTCVMANDGVLTLCLPTCDPIEQQCPQDQACMPVGDAFVCIFDAGNQGGYGDSCEAIAACVPGLVCVAPQDVPGCMSASCCTELCSLSDPAGDAQCTGAPQGQQCVPWFESDPPPEYVDLGVCRVP